MALFFNESDLKKCLKNCDFCRIPEKSVNRQMRSKRDVRRVCTHEVSDKMEKLMNHSDMSQGKRKKKRNILDSRTEFERRCKARELTNGGAARKVRPRGDVIVLDKDNRRVNSLTIVRREAIVRTAIQALDDNSSQTDNQLTSNTTPAICSPRHSAPTTTRLHKSYLFLFNSGMCPVQCENYYFVDQH
ncbi:hypothetical protein WR25_05773 [Diploscapter pachys]|uniref:Uncharacterized protein n=1 Tax=Diploscapter pachys TaxID=2018661 RepID=A0A2A2M0R4_9BILA|nr:hypothetical protein WR25_05773 [Diploscapter pachys]